MTIPTHTPPDYLDPKVAADITASINILLKRDYLLQTEVDPLMSNTDQWDALTPDQQASWLTYQSNLNAVDSRNPALVTWPTKPEV